MSTVHKRLRKASKFDVFHHWYKTRRAITDLMLVNFGYSEKKLERKLSHRYQGRPYELLNDAEKHEYDIWKEREIGFAEWYLPEARSAIGEMMRTVTSEVFQANSIWPGFEEELRTRRLHQDAALGACASLMQELQYIAEVLPVDINRFTPVAEMIDKEIALIKGWRKSDNRFRSSWATSDVSGNGDANFANVNNNGNVNNDNPDNSNVGVRADSDAHVN